MYEEIDDLPTTLRETLSEATQRMFLKLYRRAHGLSTLEEIGERSRAALAYEKAMRAVEREGVYDKETGKWCQKSELE